VTSVDDYVAELARLLPRGRRRRMRILAEVEAHLRDAAAEAGESEALERVGSARLVAAGFARRQAASDGRVLVATLLVLLATRLVLVWYVRRVAIAVYFDPQHWSLPLSPDALGAVMRVCDLAGVVGLAAVGVAAAVVLGRPGTLAGTHARVAAALLLVLGVLLAQPMRIGLPTVAAVLACWFASFALARRGSAGIDVVALAGVAATLGLAALGAIPFLIAVTLADVDSATWDAVLPLSPLLFLWGAAALAAAAAATRIARSSLSTRALRREPARPEPG
jgi:hypothetical protein